MKTNTPNADMSRVLCAEDKLKGCDVRIDLGPPFIPPYRTGSYLIYDWATGSPDHFRQGTDPLLKDGFRASGSHQVDVPRLTSMLKSIKVDFNAGYKLYLVDLRQESHVFINDRAVSWYADKDWANVGQSLEWITADEKSQLAKLPSGSTTQVFCYDKDEENQDRVIPCGYTETRVNSSATEAEIAPRILPPARLVYKRLPVTDHCIPTEPVLHQFIQLGRAMKPGDWAHFHCHGGDGRTTTFLCMYDMMYRAKTTTDVSSFPSLEYFSNRQCTIFPKYSLNPDYECGNNPPPKKRDWKYWLAYQRWILLGMVRDFIASGRFLGGEPFTYPMNWDELLGLKRG